MTSRFNGVGKSSKYEAAMPTRRYKRWRKGVKRLQTKTIKPRKFSDDETEVPSYCPQDKGK